MNAIFIWLLLIAALLLVEAMTAGLTTIWFAGGGVAALVHALGFHRNGLALVTRPLALKYMRKGSGKNSLDLMIGKEVLVTEKIDNLQGTGEAQLEGQYWMARSDDSDQTIEKGEVAVIKSIQGVKLIVARKNKMTTI